MSLRFEGELRRKLREVADQLGIPERTLAQMAIEAAVEAIVKNDYQLVIPIKFYVQNVSSPAPQPEQRYPAHREERATIEERAQEIEDEEIQNIKRARRKRP